MAVLCLLARTTGAQDIGTLIVVVQSKGEAVPGADVVAGGARGLTGRDGTLTLSVPLGPIDVVVTRFGYDPASAPVDVRSGDDLRVTIELNARSEFEETIIVAATRSERRIEDTPLRVEVVPAEEVQEKIAMTPGDVSMLLAETNGLRVQSTAPSVGGASVRIQGLRGRYTQVLSDGLPLYGSQSGSIGLLQIPPMDLAQVEVIKGVASALYGMSAIGGVVNLVSRRPRVDAPERELLVNRTSHRGTDAALWIAQSVNDRWGVSLLGGAHWQGRSDLDSDGWADLPAFRRVQARPRLLWDTGTGRSILVTVGLMNEHRDGGTMPGAAAPDGRSHPENLDTNRADAGLVGRFATSKGQVLAVRASAVTQRHDRLLGDIREDDRSSTWFGEVSLTGTTGAHTWVAGGAAQRDTFRSTQVPRFDFSYSTPGVFIQDDVAFGRRLTLSASGRLDRHNTLGTFVSPRVSALFRPHGTVTTRLSAGRGHFAPLPFTEETDATGLTPIAPLGALEPEHARNYSADVTWNRAPLEITTTLFSSRVANALMFRSQEGRYPARIVNAEQPTRTQGTEIIARYRTDGLTAIATHMYVWSTEVDGRADSRREVPLNPRHSASFDLMWDVGGATLGVELFYTGRQALEDNPFRERGAAYTLVGILLTRRVGPALLFVNAENVTDVRQTKREPLLLPQRLRDGRWTTDAWTPLDGRTVNAGLRFRF